MSVSPTAAGKVTAPFDPTQTLPTLLERFRNEQPDKPALIQGTQTRSWSESVERIYQLSNGLVELGVQPGDRVAILSRNSMAYSELFTAILIVGACAVPLQSMITAESLALMLEDSAARALIVSREMAPLAEPFLDNQAQLLPGALLGFDFTDQRFIDLEQWLRNQLTTPPNIAIDPDAEFNIIYSSGTTGVPKGIVHSHRTRQSLASGLMTLGISEAAITLISTPLYSNTTITTWWPSICAGATLIIMDKFDAQGALQLIEHHRVTHAMLVPVQYDRIMRLADFADYDLSSMQLKFCTSAPLRAALKADILERFPGELIEFYGLTEGGVGTLFVGSIASELGKLGSVGPAMPGSHLRIIDEQGNELDRGDIGEIVGRSANMSDGYHNRSDANNAMFWHDSEGQLFYRSGDVGYLDDDGWLFLSDRRKDMIISGGFNIYATDLELVLLDNPEIHEVAVVALPSRDWGETPLAIVVREDDASSAEQELKSWANDRLGKSQRISQLVFIEELPKSSIGKILKKELRASYAYLGTN